MPPETPAFICERVGVELELCRLADMTIVEDLSRQRRNMLYVSRGQLKKHSSTVLNISVSIRYISQQVFQAVYCSLMLLILKYMSINSLSNTRKFVELN